ncbi:MAG: AI-2E family transporter [Chloroflexi bacterium]|nr:AI-2E family transporter [Chloroflexota bacterium]
MSARYWHLGLLALVVAAFLLVLYLLRIVLLPILIGLVLAYLLLPLVHWLERVLPGRRPYRKRILSTLIVFFLLFGILGVFGYFLATAVVQAAMVLLQNAPEIISRGLFQLQQGLELVRQQLPPEIQDQLERTLVEGGVAIGNMIREALFRGVAFLPRNISTILGFAILPFFLFYILKDSEKLLDGFYGLFSPDFAGRVRNVVSIIEMVMGRYLKAQLMLGMIVAYFAFLGLLLLRVEFALVLAVLAGVTELIPILGPWIGGGIAVIVTLAMSPEKALWVALLFLGIQLTENSLLAPRIQSAYLHIHPAIMIVLLVLGTYLAGFWGLVLAGPLTATLLEIYRRSHHHEPAGQTG